MTSKSERLDKILVHMNVGSRSDIKKMARQGMIEVNGEIIRDSSLHFNAEEANIQVDGRPIKYTRFVYWLMNKPQGVITATRDGRERTVCNLLSEEDFLFEPFPIGRLDRDTEGFLLLTNDGELSHFLLSPKFHVPKTYYLEVKGILKQEMVDACRQGITLDDGYLTMPSELKILLVEETSSTAELTIHEGKYHQVKRMMEALGCEVTYLKRTSFGPLQMDANLALGAYRPLSDAEITALRKAVDQDEK
ncbi:MAG TPA: pseudouridine synthase [Bacillota bacterium]|nr:pseudouridine synthase [Bacillota bacterium]